MLNFVSKLSDNYKIAFLSSVFFLVNALVSSNLEKFDSLPAYLIGFTIGIASAFVGYSLNKRRRTFSETDVQIEVSVNLCKQLSVLPARVIKSTSPEVFHLICAAKAYYPEAQKAAEPDVLDVKTKSSNVAEPAKPGFAFD